MWLALFTFFSSEGRPVLNTAGQTITYNVNLDDKAILKIVFYCRKIASLRGSSGLRLRYKSAHDERTIFQNVLI